MKIKSLGNPYDENNSLTHQKNCACELCATEKSMGAHLDDKQRTEILERQADKMVMGLSLIHI